ncbi:MAG: hypothetical protein K6T16_00775 [Candidatus Pacearchaeota archaeon]|nr:hypothetical protein [Candidatus Pacearchaeota archaeon]
MKKLLALFFALATFLVLMLFITAFVAAQEQEGCCLDTGKGQQCVITTRAECPSRFYTGPPYDCSNIEECKPQTCIPRSKSEACLRNKPASECRAFGGVPEALPLESIPQCQPGCCIIAKGVKAEVLQRRQCENLTQALGYDLGMMEFKEGIISEIECKKTGSPVDLGCCVLGAGACKYGTRQECTEGNFVPLQGGLFCRDVTQCALTSHFYSDCGKLPGTETNVHWFDSQGNQEEIWSDPDTGKSGDCHYPEAMCTKDAITGKAKCQDTRCTIEGSLGSQVLGDKSPRVTRDKSAEGSVLLTGTSICYNFYTHYGDSDMWERSTGLQNQILHCSFGKIDIETLGTDREKLCDKAGEAPALIHGTVKENRWENCSECGKASGALSGPRNLVGDFFGPTYGLPGGSVFAGIGDYCTKEKCESGDYGDCIYHSDILGSSAVPVVGSAPVGSCDPKYPPGAASSKCSECGGGGDSLWNLCTRAECYSKGDCQFYGAGGRMIWTWPLLFAGLSWAERTPLIVPDCALTTLVYCPLNCPAGVCADQACYEPRNRNFFNCIGDRFGTYTLGTSVGVLKWLAIDLVYGQIVKGAIGPMIQSAAGGFGGAGG